MTLRRQRVLELIASRRAPSKAYDLLYRLQSEFPRITAATVYRAIAWLERHGLVRRIETMHAYIACSRGRQSGQVAFICDRCRHVYECDDLSLARALEICAERSGFELHNDILEVHGICTRCRRRSRGAKATLTL